MNFSSIVEKHFKSMFRWTVIVGLSCIVVLTLFWVLKARDHSKKYIISQVRESAVAGINSQNMAALDGELSRIVTSWSSTEAFPVRVDVLLDNKLWAHGGQLHPFEWPAVTDDYSESLPSGHRLDVQVQTNIGTPLKRIGLGLTTFIAFFALVFWSLHYRIKRTIREMTNPLESRIGQIQAIAADLTDLTKLKLDTKPTNVNELDALDKSLQQLIDRILVLERDLGEVHFNEGQVDAAERLAHSLNGIAANFQLTLESRTLVATDREALSSNLRRLISISENVLNARKSSVASIAKEEASLINVGDVARRLVDSRLQLDNASNRRVHLEFIDMSDKIPLAKGPRGAFEGSIGNILSNAYDAVGDDGQITVRIKTRMDLLQLEVEDNGCGIQEADLPQIVEEGFTTKESGNGLGLFHAKTTIESMGGKINILSTEGEGTKVILDLPLSLEVPAFKELVIFPGQTFVIVDDDPAIQNFFERLLLPYRGKIQLVRISSPAEFDSWMSRDQGGAPGARQYIFDCEFNRSKTTGFDLIKKYELGFESLMLSGVAHRTDVIEQASKLKVPLMPKDRLNQIQIKWEGIEETIQEMIS